MKRMILFAALLAAAMPAQAEIYKCPDARGRMVYQSDPCPGGARVRLHARHAATPVAPRVDSTWITPAAAAPPTQAQRDLAMAEKLEGQRLAAERRRVVSDLHAQIGDLEHHINVLRGQMDGDMAVLRARQGQAANNLAGASWLQSISQEMQAVTSRYQVDIDADRARIAALRGEIERLSR